MEPRTREAFNYLGQKVADITEPFFEAWSEDRWAAELALYAKPPPTEAEILMQSLSRSVEESRKWADEIIEEFKRDNLAAFYAAGISNELAIMISVHVHSRLRALQVEIGGVPFTIDLMNLVISGDLETAWVVLGLMEPDDMTMPFHWLSAERIADLRAKVGSRVGL